MIMPRLSMPSYSIEDHGLNSIAGKPHGDFSLKSTLRQQIQRKQSSRYPMLVFVSRGYVWQHPMWSLGGRCLLEACFGVII